MRKIFTVLFTLSILQTFAQNNTVSEKVFNNSYDSLLTKIMPLKDGKIYYDTIISTNGSKSELFSRAKRWELNIFKIADNPYATENEEQGFISILTGTKNIYSDYYFMSKRDSVPRLLDIGFNIRIYLKDNKARFIVSDFTVKNPIIDDQRLESNLIDEIIYYGKYGNKEYKRKSFTYNQIISLSDFFKTLDTQMKSIIKIFLKEMNSSAESSF